VARTGGDPKGGDIWDLKLEDLFSASSSKSSTATSDANGPWVINLVTSAEPISISSATLLHFEHLQLFQVTAWKSDRLLFRLRLGPIDSELQANAVLADVMREYPEAEVLAASEDDIRMISAVASSSAPRPRVPKKPRAKYGLEEFSASQDDEPPPPPRSRASMREAPASTAPPPAPSPPLQPTVERRSAPPAAPPLADRRVAPPAPPPSVERRTAPPAAPPIVERRTPAPASPPIVERRAAPLSPPPAAPAAPTAERRAQPRIAMAGAAPSGRVMAPPPPSVPKAPPGPPSWLQDAARAVLDVETSTRAAAPAVERPASPAPPPAPRAPESQPPPPVAVAAPVAATEAPPTHSTPPLPTRAAVSPAHKSLEETDTALPQLKLPDEPPRAEAPGGTAPAAKGERLLGALFDPSSDVFLELSLAPDSPREPLRDVPSRPPITAQSAPPASAVPTGAPTPPPVATAKPVIPILDTPIVSKVNRRDRRAAAKAAKAEAARRAVAARSAVASAAARPAQPAAAPPVAPVAAHQPRASAPLAPPPPPAAATLIHHAEPRVAVAPIAPMAPADSLRIAARATPVPPSSAIAPTPPPPRVVPPPASPTVIRGMPTPRPIDVPPRPALAPTERPVSTPAVKPAAMPAAAQRPVPAPLATSVPPRPPTASPAPPAAVAPAPVASPVSPAPQPKGAPAASPMRQFEVLGGEIPDLDSTQTIRALTLPELENKDAPKLFAIELIVSATQITPDQIPNLAIFNEYHLYMAIAQLDGRSAHALKLGFFPDDAPANAVAGYLSSYFNGLKVSRVSFAERERFASRRVRAGKDSGDSGTHTTIDMSSPTHAPTTSLAELAARGGRKSPKR
jgi:hypothetical protein